MTELKTKTNRLTAYAFACGYVEQKSTVGVYGEGISTELWQQHGVYNVRQNNWDNYTAPTFRVFWETFHTMAEARNAFGRAKGSLIR